MSTCKKIMWQVNGELTCMDLKQQKNKTEKDVPEIVEPFTNFEPYYEHTDPQYNEKIKEKFPQPRIRSYDVK